MSKKFKRQENWKYKRLGNKWRKPRGSKNPFTKGTAGRPANPKAGYGTKKSERGLHPSGLKEALVSNVSDLKDLTKDEHIVRIKSQVGKRKRLDIFKKAKETGIRVIQKLIKPKTEGKKVVKDEPKSSKKNGE